MTELNKFRDKCAMRGADTIFNSRKLELFVIEEDGTERTYKCDLQGGTFLVKED